MACRAVKLQLWRQNENCDSREGSVLGWREVAGAWACGIERVDPNGCRELCRLYRIRGDCVLAEIRGGRCLAGAGK